MTVSIRGRLKILAAAGAILALLIAVAWARLSRLASLVGAGPGYERVSTLLVRRFGVPEASIRPSTTVTDLRQWGVERGDFLEMLRDELRVDLSEEEAARIATIQDAARAADRGRR